MEKSRDYHLAGDFKTPDNICPYCGKFTDGVAGPEAPNEGDISICIQCYSLCIFDKDFLLRKPTEEEYGNIRSDPEIWRDIEMLRFALKATEHLAPGKKNRLFEK